MERELTARRRLERRRALRDVELAIPGAAAQYLIAMPSDPDGVLDEIQAPDPHMPYWATLWPSGLALAEVLLWRRAELEGIGVLELGCGLGVTATAAMQAGADLTAVDCFPEALAFCRYNTLRNVGRSVRGLLADWRTPEGQGLLAQRAARVVLAADVLYEAEDVAPLLDLGEVQLRRGGALWLAEPGRATSERFVRAARERGWAGETLEIEREWPAEAGAARVRVHLFSAA